MNETPFYPNANNAMAEYIAKYAGSLEVIGWIIKGNPESFTTSHMLCSAWHRQGYEIMPVYISHFIDKEYAP